jgi:hypothetical protein
MAGKGKNDPESTDKKKGTFRFRYLDDNRQFEVSADNVSSESLLEGFRQVAGAIVGRMQAAEPRRLPKNTNGGKPAEVVDDKEEETIEAGTLPFPAPTTIPEEESEEEETETTRRTRSAPRAPKFLDDLNLTTATKPLEEFVKEKNPDNDLDKYAVIAVWYKQHFSTEEFTIDHIFTAYRVLGWTAQLPGPDPSQTLRNLKNNKHWLTSPSKGVFKINWHCEDAVNKMPN